VSESVCLPPLSLYASLKVSLSLSVSFSVSVCVSLRLKSPSLKFSILHLASLKLPTEESKCKSGFEPTNWNLLSCFSVRFSDKGDAQINSSVFTYALVFKSARSKTTDLILYRTSQPRTGDRTKKKGHLPTNQPPERRNWVQFPCVCSEPLVTGSVEKLENPMFVRTRAIQMNNSTLVDISKARFLLQLL
jgi:hypothetical protein